MRVDLLDFSKRPWGETCGRLGEEGEPLLRLAAGGNIESLAAVVVTLNGQLPLQRRFTFTVSFRVRAAKRCICVVNPEEAKATLQQSGSCTKMA